MRAFLAALPRIAPLVALLLVYSIGYFTIAKVYRFAGGM